MNKCETITSTGFKERSFEASYPKTFNPRGLAKLGEARGGRERLEKKGRGQGAREGSEWKKKQR